MENLKRNYEEILEKVEKACHLAGRKPEEIEIVGVTKTVDTEKISASLDMGIKIIGENRVQEFLSKYDYLKEKDVKFHIIGTLQRNKVKYICDKVDMIQSVNSVKLMGEIDKECKKHSKIMDCLIEINIGEELSKSGANEDELQKMLENAVKCSNIRVKGLMCIPPRSLNEVEIRNNFNKLYKIYIDNKGKKMDNISMDILSMGMSADFYYAILEGANMIRVGTALYGHR